VDNALELLRHFTDAESLCSKGEHPAAFLAAPVAIGDFASAITMGKEESLLKL